MGLNTLESRLGTSPWISESSRHPLATNESISTRQHQRCLRISILVVFARNELAFRFVVAPVGRRTRARLFSYGDDSPGSLIVPLECSACQAFRSASPSGPGGNMSPCVWLTGSTYGFGGALTKSSHRSFGPKNVDPIMIMSCDRSSFFICAAKC